MLKKLGASVAVALMLATAACGGGGRPSADELSKAMQKGVKTDGQNLKLTKSQADCAAKIFVKSDISDEALRAIADRKGDYKESKADDKALEKVTPQLSKCATA